jgi:hypothetical protein
MSQTKLSLAGKNFIPGQGEFGKSHPGGAGKPLTFFTVFYLNKICRLVPAFFGFGLV